MATIRNKSLLRSLVEQEQHQQQESSNSGFRQVPVTDLKKVSRAISILQQSNSTLAKLVNNLQVYYERKYKSKVLELQAALQIKTQKIAEIETDLMVEYLFVIKIRNRVYLLDKFERVNRYLSENQECRVILCRILKSSDVERALISALAVSKCPERICVNGDEIIFQNISDLDKFENELRIMYS
ncbi:hypothetical protein [Alphabaculovirus altersperidaniae]|uniref:Uncharacterized protein n=1 Tax=Spodoptera eridania nucleopolyhedrovirus TaxID=2315721 RepID=A0ABX6TQ54_9ABAC|nr:hypothetical protein QKS47_gp030 [Spodoptera eridania nucleopolyhedrovirus]QNV47785.1 hypothetical protein [Spodoptera eridania nucleopolyhedrovirus]